MKDIISQKGKNKRRNAISISRIENYSEWYQEVIRAADLAEHSEVRGCMIIKPYGYAIWELMQAELDKQIKATGHLNCYFPLFLPLSALQKEANHVDGFANECAVVTHHRLEKNDLGKLIPTGELEEPLIVRPTSEVVIGMAFARWIQSYRDLPLLLNQWANVVRWEMRPRLLLRTMEFLWQEGHTAHVSANEALNEAKKMLEVYRLFMINLLALSPIVGCKTQNEKFPGADTTYCLEAIMQDGKALQVGTSHFLGQNFAKAFDIRFQSQNETQEYAWTTSWGVTTRLLGAVLMTHSDDDGLVLPPKIAPYHCVILPVIHHARKKADNEHRGEILGDARDRNNADELRSYISRIRDKIAAGRFDEENIRVFVDDNEHQNASEKKWKWIKKGAPIQIEIGFREMTSGELCARLRYDSEISLEQTIMINDDKIADDISRMLGNMQQSLSLNSSHFLALNLRYARSSEEFENFFKSSHEYNNKDQSNLDDSIKDLNDKQCDDGYRSPFVLAFWSEDENTENYLKTTFSITPRSIVFPSLLDDIALFNPALHRMICDDARSDDVNQSPNDRPNQFSDLNSIGTEYEFVFGSCIFTKNPGKLVLFARAY